MNNGLTKPEEKQLRLRLTQLNELLTRRCLMGGREAHEMAQVAGLILSRLQPLSVEEIDRKAREQIDRHEGLDWAREALWRAEAV